MNKKNIADIYKLSPVQQALLFAYVIEPESGISFQQAAQRHPTLNPDLYLQAWEQLLERHTALRSAYFWDDLSDPLQVVMRKVELPVKRLDWHGKTENEWRSDLDALLLEERADPFDPTKAPLLRLVLIALDDGQYIVVINFHHINVDGWSLQVMLNELNALYNALQAGVDARLPVPRPFGDYVAWLGKQDMSETAEFWRNEVAGFETPTGMPQLVRAEGLFSGYGEHNIDEFWLPDALVEQIEAYLQKTHLSFATLMQAAWSLLLARYNDTDDMICGMVVHGRPTNFDNFERMVGMFVNALPVRVQISADQSVTQWLTDFQTRLREMERHSYFATPEIHKISDLKRSQPLFETLVVDQIMRGVPNEEQKAESLVAFEKSSLLLSLYLRQRDLIWIDYDAVDLDPKTVARLVEHLFFILEQIVRDGAAVAEIGLPAPAQTVSDKITEVDDVLVQFARQVTRTPEKIALRCGSMALTFRELDARANQLARWLQQEGIGREDKVGILMARSAEMVIAMLAILKANAAYVPLSMTDPEERVRFIIDDADVEIVLTLREQQPQLAAYGVQTCAVDDPALRQLDSDDLALTADPNQLAYIIYTSGSTGRPKGVLIERRSLSAIAKTDAERFNITERDTVMQFATIVFDTSVEEIFSALTTGAELVIRTPEMLDSVAAFCAALAENNITTLEMVTAYWHLLVDELVAGTVELPLSLRQIVIGGEAVAAEKVRQWHALRLGIDLVNSYGPTETTVTATSVLLDPALPDDRPIGTPWPTVTAHILDRDMRPMPDGIPGELFLSGIGVARGYHKRPDETAARFVNNGERLYRTGDRVLRRDDGQLEFLGRADMQVKVRGFRVELGAIEARLREHPAVENVVVVQHASNKQLIAFIEGSDDNLAAWLGRQLPLYMIPAAFVTLDQFPVNSRGKIDRDRLAAEDVQLTPTRQGEFVAAETEIEEQISDIWCKLLKVEEVSVLDDFFALGGHSLLATQMVQRINAAYSVNISIRDVFDQSTIAELGLLVEEQLLDMLEMA